MHGERARSEKRESVRSVELHTACERETVSASILQTRIICEQLRSHSRYQGQTRLQFFLSVFGYKTRIFDRHTVLAHSVCCSPTSHISLHPRCAVSFAAWRTIRKSDSECTQATCIQCVHSKPCAYLHPNRTTAYYAEHMSQRSSQKRLTKHSEECKSCPSIEISSSPPDPLPVFERSF